MPNKTKKIKGFTLIELLLYVAIFGIVVNMLSGILVAVTQISNRQSASSEVTNQLNFVMKTIELYVRQSSNIDISPGMATSTLKLRMPNSAIDPTIIALSGNAVTIQQGSGPGLASSTLTSNTVSVSYLSFKKYVQPPGHDTISIDMTMNYNSQNSQSRLVRSLHSAIARVSAATFDSPLLPAGPPYSYTIGQSGSPWQNIVVANGSAVGPAYTFDGNTGVGLFIPAANILGFSTAGMERMRIDGSGRVGIGKNPGTLLDVNGTITGVTKNFEIPDPAKPGFELIHSTLEGPEIAVFYRGEGRLTSGKTEIVLPAYFEALTRKQGRTVLLTPEFDSPDEPISSLAASSVVSGKFAVRSIDNNNPNQRFYWEVKAVRADQPLLEVEKKANSR